MEINYSKYAGIYSLSQNNKRITVTENLTPKKKFFNEKTFAVNNKEYREFDPFHSKLSAAVIKKISLVPIKEGDKILYLGASHGYTASYVSDMVKEKGVIFCVDFAPRVVRDLLFVCEQRQNMLPILASANKPETYKDRITQVDLIYQDIAQKNQIEILSKNLQFLKPRGYILIAVKARSIDVTKQPQKVFREVEEQLKQKLKIIDQRDLSPFQKDHCFYVCQMK